MKKILCVALALLLLFSLAACMDKDSGEPQSTSQPSTSMRNPSESSSTPSTSGGADNNGGIMGGSDNNGGANGSTSGNANDNNSNSTSGNNDTSASARTAPMNNSTEVQVSDSDFKAEGAGMIIKGTSGGSSLSGLLPLNSISYEVKDPNNSSGLSTKKLSHSHGPASGGKPHHTVVEFQNGFDKYGAVTLDRKTQGKVLYLTFDCGWEYENLTSDVLDTLKEKHVPAAFFCTLDHMKKQPELIARMIKEGHIVGNHSTSHPSFAEISRTQMKDEIEETENFLRKNFGYCAKYFRFPAGEYNESALDLVASLGYMSVFWSVAYNDWNVDSIKGKDYAVDVVGKRLHDGAIILLHAVSKDNASALGDIIENARAEGYEFKALTDYKG